MQFVASSRKLVWSCAPLILAAAFGACASKDGGSGFMPGANANSSSSSSSAGPSPSFEAFGDSGAMFSDSGTGAPSEPNTKLAGLTYSDLPAAPIVDAPDGGGAAAPANAPNLFGAPAQGASSGGPCLIEPEVGALYPDNWLRPRFRWVPASNENLFELRLHVGNQQNDLVVYTTSNEWTMPKALWDRLRADSYDEAITVSVRGGVLANGSLTGEAFGSSGAIGIAPVNAPGTIVYWTPSPDTALKGFAVGDESVTSVLLPGQVAEYGTTCVGCHNSTPDGNFASFAAKHDNWGNGFANITPGKTGAVPNWLGSAARSAVEQGPVGIHTFSKAHWSPGDRVELATYNPNDNSDSELAWIDVEATSAPAMGILARTGDSRHAGAPSWSHDGKTVAYVSTEANVDGRLDDGDADIYLVPYNNRAGGAARPLQGANDPNARDYYPAFSPDDKLVAFDKAASGNMYNNSGAEVYVVSSAGGAATRLQANDPPACTGQKSPGVTNSWPKWAPAVASLADGRTFYWVVFSSTRDPYTPDAFQDPQLYLAAVVVDANGNTTTYGSLYFWNQPEKEHNHTPAWEYFMIPPAAYVPH
jgi:hypothetical protein